MPNTHAPSSASHKAADLPDIAEYGAPRESVRQTLNKRLYMQLLVFTGCPDAQALVKPIDASGLEAVLYLDASDPRGVGILLMSEDPALFTNEARRFLNTAPFSSLMLRPEFTMLGRSYSGGFEQDLEDWLLQKPRRNVFNQALGWVVWYPLRRKPEFETLTKEEQRAILMEHARLGMSYGAAELAHDVRLACHGLDARDNEFVIGVLAKDLHPISRLIQDMRKTQQTSKYIQSMGPFFVGRAFHRTR